MQHLAFVTVSSMSSFFFVSLFAVACRDTRENLTARLLVWMLVRLLISPGSLGDRAPIAKKNKKNRRLSHEEKSPSIEISRSPSRLSALMVRVGRRVVAPRVGERIRLRSVIPRDGADSLRATEPETLRRTTRK